MKFRMPSSYTAAKGGDYQKLDARAERERAFFGVCENVAPSERV
jgi:hypothetical protein